MCALGARPGGCFHCLIPLDYVCRRGVVVCENNCIHYFHCTVKITASLVRGVSFISRFDIDKITHIGWFRFMEEIVNNRYDFVLYAAKRFKSRRDVRVLRCTGDGTSWCIMNLLEAFELCDR